MTTYENNNGILEISGTSSICSTEEFQVETTQDDGSMLEVVDESTHEVVGYYIAYHGYWNKR